jgi:PAS domain S-box-containing protein
VLLKRDAEGLPLLGHPCTVAGPVSPEQDVGKLLEEFPDALIAVTPDDGCITFWSRGAQRVFGYTSEEVIGRSLIDVLVPLEHHELERQLLRTATEGALPAYEGVRKSKDGKTVYVDVSMRAVTDVNGALMHIAVSKKDITHLRSIRESAIVEDKFRGILETASDAMVMVDTAGRIMLMNDEAQRLFGYDGAELSGQPVEVLVPERLRTAHEAHRVGYSLDPKTRLMGARLDLFGRRKDGSEFPAEISLKPLRTPAGTVTTVAIRDVGDRRNADLRFRAFLEAAPDPVMIVDREGSIVLVNAQTERLFGYPRNELIGKPVEHLIPTRFRGEHPGHRLHYALEPRPRSMGSGLKLHALRRDGTEFPVEISLGPIVTEVGTLVSCTISDVTDRQRTETALRAAHAELEAFSYSVAHDLRAPLRGMNGFAQILLDEYSDKLDAAGIDCLHEIHDNAVRMGALIDALLSLAHISRTTLKPERIDLTRLAQDAFKRLKAEDPQRQVEVVLPDHLWAYLDPQLARNLIDNLLDNAWKFTGKTPHARIELGTANTEGVSAYFVRDNGAGFDMAHKSKLFGPFQRLHSMTEFRGTGIGLATAQRVAVRHGGRIWADGVVNGGATFYFWLPGPPAEAIQ